METGLIIALDFDDRSKALSLVDKLDPKLCILKVGQEMFTLFGPEWVRYLVKKQFRVFLDLKFHDIPNTVARACAASAELGVWMVNIHALGGLAMMQAAERALVPYGASRPLLIAVTILTSMSAVDVQQLGISMDLEKQVLHLARLAKAANLDGVVCSAWEVPEVKQACGQGFITVTPGIRLSQDSQDDQTRIVTPERALQLGSDHVVIGRPITQASDPIAVVHDLWSKLHPKEL